MTFRRYGEPLPAIFEQYPTSRFVTGLIAELDLASGRRPRTRRPRRRHFISRRHVAASLVALQQP